MLIVWILALAIAQGQLVKIPLLNSDGITILDVVIIFLCLLGILETNLKFKKPPLFIISALLFILIALIALLLTPLHLNLSDYLISFFYTVRFSSYILLGWLIYSGALTPIRQNIKKILFFSGLGLSILGLIQFIFIPDLSFLKSLGWDPHYFRTVSTFLDPNFAGAYFTLTLMLLMDKKIRGWTLIFFVISYLALLTTFSRSSYLMFAVSGITLSFFKKTKILGLIIIVLFLGLLIGFQIYTNLVAKPRNIDRTQSASYRLNTWQQGLAIFRNSPILGVGFNSYRYGIREYNLGDAQFLESKGSSTNDSSLLFVLSTTGLIGFFCYLLFIFFLLKLSWSKNLILFSGLTGLLIHSFFANSLFYPPILLWIIMSAVSKK